MKYTQEVKDNIKKYRTCYKSENVVFKKKSVEQLNNGQAKSKYHTLFHSMSENKSIVLDVYDMLDALELPNAEIEHTFKKIVRCGKGDKDLLTDLKEAYTQLGMGIKRIERVLNKEK